MGAYRRNGKPGGYDMLAEATDVKVTVSMTRSMKALIEWCAKVNSLTVAEYMRIIIRTGAGLGSYEQPLLPCNTNKDNDCVSK